LHPRALLDPKLAFQLSFLVSLANIIALVKELFAFGYAKLALDDASFKIDLQGNKGQPFLIHDPPQAFDLLAMHQELPAAKRFVVDPVAIDILGDVEINQNKLVVFHERVGVRERESPVLDGLDLRPDKHHPALEGFVYAEIESSLFIDREDLDPLM
jgi:hypothetical protein